jgi:adenosylhomocysteine nucleosidase
MVGVIFANRIESRVLRRLTENRSRLKIVESGIGIENASSAAKRLIERGVSFLINCGTAGGIDPDRRIGDIVVAERVIGEDGVSFEIGGYLVQRVLKSAKQEVFPGSILTAKGEVKSEEFRRMLWQRFGAQCVDMEALGVVMVSSLYQIPCFVAKGITDLSGEGTRYDFLKNVEMVSRDIAHFVLYLLELLGNGEDTLHHHKDG